jgi:hypothetical protein
MAFEHQEPCEQDPNDAGMSHLGDARRRPIAFGTAVMFMMSFVLSWYRAGRRRPGGRRTDAPLPRAVRQSSDRDQAARRGVLMATRIGSFAVGHDTGGHRER